MKIILILSIFLVTNIQAASFKEQAEQNYYEEKKFRWVEKILCITPLFVGGVLAAKLLAKKDSPLSTAGGAVMASVFANTLISQSISWQVMDILKSVAKNIVSYWPGSVVIKEQSQTDKILITLEIYKLEYQQKKHLLSKDAQALFEKLEVAANNTKTQSNLVMGSEESVATYLKNKLSRILNTMRTLLDLPQELYPIVLDDNLKTKLKPMLDRYPDELQEDIKHFIFSIIRSSSKPQSSKLLMYLVGESGTGKTKFIKSFAEAAGLPMIDMLDLEKAIDQKEFLFNHDGSINESFQLSLLTKFLLGKPRNTVLFLNKLDKLEERLSNQNYAHSSNLVSFLDQLLDPEHQTIRLPDLDIEIDISGLIIIAEGNEPLKTNSLRSRLPELRFPCIAREKRLKIAEDRFANQMNQEDIGMIKQIAEQDPYCGVRSLELVVDDYVFWKEFRLSDWNFDSGFNVTKMFQKHPNR